MLARAYPGTPVSWWLEQCETDEQMIATALAVATEQGESSG